MNQALATLPRRRLGKIPWEASLLTLGGVKWDHAIPEAEAVELIHRALELGVNTIDTAHGYSAGKSEERLGLALEGRRDEIFLSTKSTDRTRDGARRQIEKSLQRLRTDRIDLFFLHGLDDAEDLKRILAPDSVLDAVREFQDAGVIRHVGVSGHWYKESMLELIQQTELDAILCPVGLFNEAYRYDYREQVIPAARERNLAVMAMKILGAGRAKHARSIEPYLRYAYRQPVDTLVIGCDSIPQLEEIVEILSNEPEPLRPDELPALYKEAQAVTQSWDKGEFAWVNHYRK